MTSILPLSSAGRFRHGAPSLFKASRLRGELLVSGYALQFGALDNFGTWYEATGWPSGRTVEVPIILSHNPEQEVGVCALSPDAEGVFAEATIDDVGGSIAGAIKTARYSCFSADIVLPPSATVRFAAGKPFSIEQWDIAAVSLVGMEAPAVRQSADRGPVVLHSRAELVELLRASGLARGAAERIAAGGWPALETATAPTITSINSTIETLTKSLMENSK